MISQLSEKDKRAYNLIRNKLVHEGVKPTLKEINDVTGGKSPRSASIVIDRLVGMGLLKRVGKNLKLADIAPLDSISITTINVPLVGLVSCGLPIFAEENIEAYIPISTALAKKGFQYFLLRASGDSMNLAGIQSGDILLVRQQAVANEGEKVVALINDEATVKVLEKKNGHVILRPKSSNQIHKPIVLTDDCQIQGTVVSVLSADLY